MNTTCPNNPALGTSHEFLFNKSSSVTNSFNITAGVLKHGSESAAFTVAKKGDCPTIQSKFYIMFGRVSVIMKAGTGQGIISSIVLESDDLDEVDWEFLGGNGTHVESNYFGKGNTTAYDRAIYHPVDFDPRSGFHNYSLHWTSDKLEWWIDSKLVRTLPYGAAYGGYNYPQTPMTVRLGIWAAGDKDNPKGTVDWAGGVTDYSKGPYTMDIHSTQIADFGTGKEYVWTDKSGSWTSIKSVPGNSTALKRLMKEAEPPTPTLAERFASLPTVSKLILYCCAGALAAILLSAAMFVCHRTRRAGRLERDAYNAKMQREREESYKDQVELRDKGYNGWDSSSQQTQVDTTVGDWGTPQNTYNNRMAGMNESTASDYQRSTRASRNFANQLPQPPDWNNDSGYKNGNYNYGAPSYSDSHTAPEKIKFSPQNPGYHY
ncbi:hypothetical protein K3495_g1622 [Podosphaera aphanis]|nr:hypothetical protein K3495_g1622 [Podosphaera aphanis]